jgi:hypothetical protein
MELTAPKNLPAISRKNVKTRLILCFFLTAAALLAYTAHPVTAKIGVVPVKAKAQEKNRDATLLSWLGALPAGLRVEILSDRMGRVLQSVRNDLSTTSRADDFICKTPAQVGPVPMMDAVERYIDGMPESASDQAILIGLDDAARRGNWLARVQLYAWLSEYAGEDLVLGYRQIQLMEWMQKQRIGALYAFFGEDLAASGYYSDSPGDQITGIDIYAAMHNSYPAQNKVGKQLVSSGDPSKVSLGKKMLACASGSLPSYARVFNGEAEKARTLRQEQAERARLLPLHRAVVDGDVALVRQLLESKKGDPNARTDRDQTPLDFAMLSPQQSAPIVKLLIEHGADVVKNGAADKRSSERDATELLNRAVKAKPASLDIVQTLTQAGAEPIQTTAINHYAFNTPFADAFDAYESGENPAILEYFLNLKKLDPRSEIAMDYLEMSVRYPKVMERLLAYGISPVGSENILSELARASTNGVGFERADQYIGISASLVNRYPLFIGAIRTKPGYQALSTALYDCHFGYANWLLDMGAPVRTAGSDTESELVKIIVKRCGRAPDKLGDVGRLEKINELRKSVLYKLHAKNVGFNARVRNCPAWMSGAGSCEPPSDDALVDVFLTLGADPYLIYSDREQSALNDVIRDCRVTILDKMLAKPPRNRTPLVQSALNDALEQTTRELWEGLNCPEDFTRNAARKLISYGAHKSD